MKALAVAGVFCAALGSFAAVSNACEVPTFHFIVGGITPVFMSLRSGEVCTFYVLSKVNNTVEGGIVSTAFKKRPRHGVAGKAEKNRYAYQANPNYVGPDEFVVALRYNGAKVIERTTLDVKVTVAGH
ncbi:MAG: hypothetical protein P4L98_18910 [Ancalomicrobiaceae bacterium]|nr:hypothetical protein [Ancalomicrobiaceae bacterium]